MTDIFCPQRIAAILSLFCLTASIGWTEEKSSMPVNPYWPMANRAMEAVVALPESELLVEQHGHNAFFLAWGLTSPHSNITEQADRDLLREKLIQVWDAASIRLREGDILNTGSMWNLLASLDSLLALEKHEVFPAEKLNGWKEALRPAVDDIYLESGKKTDRDWVTSSAFEYPNADAQHAAIMAAASLVYGEPNYAKTAAAFAHSMEDFLYPPGEWRYRSLRK